MEDREERGRCRSREGKEIKKIGDRLRKSPKSALGLSEWALRTALCIVSLTDTTFSLAVDWLKEPHRRSAAVSSQVTRETLQRLLEDIILASSPHDIVSWAYADTTPSRSALAAARKTVARHNMLTHVLHANEDNGIAPSSRSLWENYLEESSMSPEAASQMRRNWATTAKGRTCARMFMMRWRRRKGVKIGRIRFGEPLTLEEKRAMVCPKFLDRTYSSEAPAWWSRHQKLRSCFSFVFGSSLCNRR